MSEDEKKTHKCQIRSVNVSLPCRPHLRQRMYKSSPAQRRSQVWEGRWYTSGERNTRGVNFYLFIRTFYFFFMFMYMRRPLMMYQWRREYKRYELFKIILTGFPMFTLKNLICLLFFFVQPLTRRFPSRHGWLWPNSHCLPLLDQSGQRTLRPLVRSTGLPGWTWAARIRGNKKGWPNLRLCSRNRHIQTRST